MNGDTNAVTTIAPRSTNRVPLIWFWNCLPVTTPLTEAPIVCAVL